jgi:hypothetical protein
VFFKGKKVKVSIIIEDETTDTISQFNELQMLLLSSPEMSDEEYHFVQVNISEVLQSRGCRFRIRKATGKFFRGLRIIETSARQNTQRIDS